MNKPHVDKLYYNMIIDDSVDYEKAPPLTHETDVFTMIVDDNRAIFAMEQHFEFEADARKITDSFLEDWKVLIGLHGKPDEITFKYNHADIIDLEPKPNVIELRCSLINETATSDISIHISKDRYPDPPINFTMSPDVETMFNRFKMYRQGREQLLSTAFFILSVLELSAKDFDSPKSSNHNRHKASEKYNISMTILNKLHTLTSRRGGPSDARKAQTNGTPLTGPESSWMEGVCRLIIERVGAYEFSGPDDLTKLTMNDLPSLQ